MKKTIVLALVVFLVFSCMVVGASADTYTSIRGVWRFNDTISLPDDMFILEEETILFTNEEGRVFTGMHYDGAMDYLVYDDGFTGDIIDAYGGSWVSGQQTITITDGEASARFIDWLQENAVEQICDGSSCPVGDSNNDSYCDDCGAKMRTITEGVPIFPSDLPSPPSDALGNNQEIIIMRTADGTKLYSYNHAIRANHTDHFYYVWGNSNNNNVILEATTSSASGNAYLLTGGKWVYSGILSGDYTLGKYEDIIYSSVIIYDENGEYFFPLTLWAQILKVGQGAMKTETPTIHSSMVLLALCGIGCLALLMALPLLKKVLYKFL